MGRTCVVVTDFEQIQYIYLFFQLLTLNIKNTSIAGSIEDY